MYIVNGTEQIIEKETGIEYEVSGPISGMYLVKGAGQTKLVTPSQLRRQYVFHNKPVAIYNSKTDGNGCGFLIRKKFIEELKKIDSRVEILYEGDTKTDYYRYPGGTYFMMTTWSKPSFWIYVKPEDISPSRKRYITRRMGTEGPSRCLTAQFRITEITSDTLALMRGIIIDAVFENKDIVKS